VNILQLVIIGIVGFAVSVAIFKRPAVGAALILGFVHFERVLVFNGISLVKLLSIICIGILVFRVLSMGKGLRFDLTTWLIALFMAWISITVFWSSNQTNILSELVSLILQSLMYFLIINLVRSKDDLKLALWGHVIGGSVMAVILSSTMISLNFVRSTDLEIGGLGINLAARMVGLNLLLAVILFQIDERRLAKIILIGVAIVSGVGSLLALSRGNWYALIMSAIALFIVLNLKKGYKYPFKQILLIAAIGLVTLYVANRYIFSDYGLSKLQERSESAITFSDGASGRFGIWQTAFTPFMENPIFGNGFNTFKRLNEWKHTGAHNAFVLIAVEDGLVGVLLFSLVLGSVFLSLVNLLKKEHGNPIALGWGMALFVFLGTVSLVDSAVNRKYLWFVLGIISLLVFYYGDTQSSEESAVEIASAGNIKAVKQLAYFEKSG
jgi:O-antigen ligase